MDRQLNRLRNAFWEPMRLTATPWLAVIELAAIWLVTLTGTALAQEAKQTSPQVVQSLETRVLRDQVFDASQAQSLMCDVYLPSAAQVANRGADDSGNSGQPLRPAVLLIHGGAWSSGSKSLMVVHAQQLASIGIVAIAMDYRHAPLHTFPAQVDDVRSALVWIKSQADEFAIDLERVGLFGYSAGGHLACLLAALADEPRATQIETSSWPASDPRWEQLPAIKAVVAGGPPCDFRSIVPDDRTLSFFLGGTPAECPQRYVCASPAAHVSSGDVAICFIHGENDAIVLASDSRAMFDAQREQGVPSQYLLIDKQGHMLTFLHSRTRATMEEYFRDQFQLNQ